MVEFGGVRSGDPFLLSSVPGRPRGNDGGEGWILGRLCLGICMAVCGLAGLVWTRVADWRAGVYGGQGLNQAIGFARALYGSGSGWEMSMAREHASGERAGALFTNALCHNKATQTRHGRRPSLATNESRLHRSGLV